eukprot:6578539-Pyramimonas_sp.AAC.1
MTSACSVSRIARTPTGRLTLGPFTFKCDGSGKNISSAVGAPDASLAINVVVHFALVVPSRCAWSRRPLLEIAPSGACLDSEVGEDAQISRRHPRADAI